jgi:hypothetical protein
MLHSGNTLSFRGIMNYGWHLVETEESWVPSRDDVPDVVFKKKEYPKSVAETYILGRVEEERLLNEGYKITTKFAWDLPSSILYRVKHGRRSKMVGWAQRLGDQHKEIGWMAFVVGVGLLPYNRQYYFPDECMAKQAVLDTVEAL